MRQIIEGEYKHPARIVVFNTAEGWSRDVTVEIADALRRCFSEFDVAPAASEFHRESWKELIVVAGSCLSLRQSHELIGGEDNERQYERTGDGRERGTTG